MIMYIMVHVFLICFKHILLYIDTNDFDISSNNDNYKVRNIEILHGGQV